MILIFTEALKETGLGHFSRCCALAEILNELNLKAEIILHSDIPIPFNQISLSIIRKDWTNSSELASVFKTRQVSVSCVDSYLASEGIYDKIRANSTKLICIDDTNRISYPKGAYILNTSIGSDFVTYDMDNYTVIKGIEYAMLRKPFREAITMRPIAGTIQSLLITIGGADPQNLMPLILELVHHRYPDWRKDIIITSAFKNLAEINAIGNKNVSFHIDVDPLEMRNMMLNVDLAITAGGQTLMELARCGVPIIAIEIAENQHHNVAYMVSKRSALTAGTTQNPDFKKLLLTCLENISAKDVRTSLRQNAMNLVKPFQPRHFISLFSS